MLRRVKAAVQREQSSDRRSSALDSESELSSSSQMGISQSDKEMALKTSKGHIAPPMWKIENDVRDIYGATSNPDERIDKSNALKEKLLASVLSMKQSREQLERVFGKRENLERNQNNLRYEDKRALAEFKRLDSEIKNAEKVIIISLMCLPIGNG